ncbi:cysteine protease ATG4B-like [Iris pallida]|uniref:Cysteine protease n=1 Tax=Iris pallida TaxID=29817 RepID=A0AAX6G141_IRIPA|nr:cysteine protease ATG4B-like [Iris pallida]
MAVYVVSGDEDGERGGAPVICVDVAARLCSDFSKGQLTWTPMLLLVPLVLGLEKVNPRYIPLLRETFTFPQSLGILGGKPGASTYMVGVQDDKALYLDPHEVQPAIELKRDNLEVDTSSYHCRGNVRNLPLDQIDPSLAIGFYCRDKDDFEDLCSCASELGEKSNGAPLFTVSQCRQPTRPVHRSDSSTDTFVGGACNEDGRDELDNFSDCDLHNGEDDWQIL